MLREIIEYVALNWLKLPRIIYDQEGKNPYLTRYYLTKRPTMPDGSSPFDTFGNPKREAVWPSGISVLLHHFHRSDADRELHNHPWEWALSFVLVGGYIEERRVATSVSDVLGYDVIRREVKPFTFNYITIDDFHRVDLRERDAWTIFITGPKVKSWGFWDRCTNQFTEWRQFLASRKRK